jgi:tape measure domain-containing protein
MTNVSGANIKLGATSDGAIKELDRLRAKFALFSREVSTKVAMSFRTANDATKEYKKGLGDLSDKLTDLSKKLLLITALPALFLGQQAYKDFANVQRLERGLAQYGETLEKVRRLAKEPNIGVFDGAKALIGLRAARIEAGLAERAIRSFANAITLGGGSAADLEPALFNLKQFKATQHINQVDLRQLANRVPQTMEALERAFGTTDTTKLNSLGIDKFLEGFVSELERLPKAAGGAAVAMEQLSDSATFFSAAFGEGLDRTFNISNKISALGAFLDNLTTNFKALNPEGQKSVVWFTALPVVIALVVTGFAGLAKALLFLGAAAKVGLAAMTPPQFLAVAAVVIGVAAAIGGLIAVVKLLTNETADYKQQQEEVNNLAPKIDPLIKKYDELKKISKPNLEQQRDLKTVISQIAELVPTAATAWDKYGRAIDINKTKVRGFVGELQKALKLMEPMRRQILATELGSSKTRADELRRQLTEGTKVASLDMGRGQYQNVTVKMTYAEIKKAAEELTQIEGRRVELQKELVSLGSKGVVQKQNELNAMVTSRNQMAAELAVLSRGYKTTDELVKINKLKNQIHALDDQIKEAKTSTTQLINAWNESAANSRTGIASPGTSGKDDTKRLSAMSVDELGEKVTELTDKYKSLGPEEENYLQRKREILSELIRTQKRYVELKKPIDDITQASKALKDEWIPMTKLQYMLWEIDLERKIYDQSNAVKKATQEYKDLKGALGDVNVKMMESKRLSGDIGGLDAKSKAARLKENDDRLKGRIGSGTKGYLQQRKSEVVDQQELTDAFVSTKQKDGESIEDYKDRVKEIVRTRKQANAEITSSIRQSGAEAGVAFGEMLGNLVNGENAMQSFATRVLSILGALLKDIGKSLIALGVAGEAFNFFRDKPALAIGAGIALTAAGQAVSNSAQKKVRNAAFAEGGMARKRMQATIGDNPGAHFDPEIVAPYSKVHKSLRDSVKEIVGNQGLNGGSFVIRHEIDGNKLVVLMERTQASRKGLLAKR